MAAEVKPVAQVQFAAKPSALSPEQTYWRTFKSPLNITSPTSHGVTHISQPSTHPNPLQTLPDTFVVTTGARLQIFSHRTRKLLKTITRFDDTAHSGEIRYDGRVVVAGDETGAIQVFDVNSRAILKSWKEHKQPVWSTKWHPRETTTLMSASDDTTVKLWDLPGAESITTFRGHQDYVRSGAFMPGNGSNFLVSGSYDQTVRLWDPRASERAVMTFKHTGAVEAVLPMPSGTTILASAENQIAVLDVIAAKPLHLIKNHQKTVTALCLASNGSRVVSGSLDGHMKVFETTGWNVVAGSKYPSPILSLAIITSGPTREDKHVAVGLSSGLLSIKTRLSGAQKVRERERQKEMAALIAGTIDEHDRKLAKKRPRGWEKRFRGRDSTVQDADIIIDDSNRRHNKKKNQPEWQLHLHRGHYREALDHALQSDTHTTTTTTTTKKHTGSSSSSTNNTLTVLTALHHRSALPTALSHRDELTLQPILDWTHKHISHPNFTPLCVDAAMHILHLYARHLGRSESLERQVRKLHLRVRAEVEKAQQACLVLGMLALCVPEVGEEAG
jgi:U3 small nucleolar RNA-associated protein 15